MCTLSLQGSDDLQQKWMLMDLGGQGFIRRVSTVHRTNEKPGKIVLESEQEVQEKETKQHQDDITEGSAWTCPLAPACLCRPLPSSAHGSAASVMFNNL